MRIDLANLKSEYDKYDSLREKVIIQSRSVLKSAKKAIYAVHKGNKSEATKLKNTAEKDFKKLKEVTKKHVKLQFEGSFNEASEEYAEAILYYDFVYNKELSTIKELGIKDELYLGALSDLTGELARKAVSLAIKKDTKGIEEINEFISNIYKKILSFNFRNGQLRKKTDSIKWNLSKVEDILYDIAIRNK